MNIKLVHIVKVEYMMISSTRNINCTKDEVQILKETIKVLDSTAMVSITLRTREIMTENVETRVIVTGMHTTREKIKTARKKAELEGRGVMTESMRTEEKNPLRGIAPTSLETI